MKKRILYLLLIFFTIVNISGCKKGNTSYNTNPNDPFTKYLGYNYSSQDKSNFIKELVNTTTFINNLVANFLADGSTMSLWMSFQTNFYNLPSNGEATYSLLTALKKNVDEYSNFYNGLTIKNNKVSTSMSINAYIEEEKDILNLINKFIDKMVYLLNLSETMDQTGRFDIINILATQRDAEQVYQLVKDDPIFTDFAEKFNEINTLSEQISERIHLNENKLIPIQKSTIDIFSELGIDFMSNITGNQLQLLNDYVNKVETVTVEGLKSEYDKINKSDVQGTNNSSQPEPNYETAVCRIIVDGTQKIALTGKTKSINYAKQNYSGHIVIKTKDGTVLAEFDNDITGSEPSENANTNKLRGKDIIVDTDRITINDRLQVTGSARNLFEGTLCFRLKDSSGKLILDSFTTVDAGDAFSPFTIDEPVNRSKAKSTSGTLEFYIESMEDGSPEVLISVPVIFN